MNVSALIDAQLEGKPFDDILEQLRPPKNEDLAEDHRDFLESMLEEVQSASVQLEDAVKRADLPQVKSIAQSFQEIFKMMEDSCEGHP